MAGLALLAIERAPTAFAVSYASSLLRHFLALGGMGLDAIFRAETELRVVGEDMSLAMLLVDGATEGDTDALQLINDFLVQCSGESGDRLLKGVVFFSKKHVHFQKNTHIDVFGVKHIKSGVIFELARKPSAVLL